MTSKKQIVPHNSLQTSELPQTLMSNIIHQIELAKSQVAGYANVNVHTKGTSKKRQKGTT